MRRRTFLSAPSLVPWVVPWGRASAQAVQRRPKVAILAPSSPAEARTPGTINSFLSALTGLGYVDGQSVSLEFRFAEYVLERLPALAAELVATQPDVLWTWTSGGALAATAATSTIPIVIAPVSEAIMARIVADFARPNGTGARIMPPGPLK